MARPTERTGLAIFLLDMDKKRNGEMSQAFKQTELSERFIDPTDEILRDEVAHWVAKWMIEEGREVDVRFSRRDWKKMAQLIEGVKE